MLTLITDIDLKESAEQRWDAIMRKRMMAVKTQPGWIGGQLLRSDDKPPRRVIVGTWRGRADWEKWHRDPQFVETRQELDQLVSGPERHRWHQVVLDVRKAAKSARPARSRRGTARSSKRKTR
jgi:heme-degrading monooxygenase HmoA